MVLLNTQFRFIINMAFIFCFTIILGSIYNNEPPLNAESIFYACDTYLNTTELGTEVYTQNINNFTHNSIHQTNNQNETRQEYEQKQKLSLQEYNKNITPFTGFTPSDKEYNARSNGTINDNCIFYELNNMPASVYNEPEIEFIRNFHTNNIQKTSNFHDGNQKYYENLQFNHENHTSCDNNNKNNYIKAIDTEKKVNSEFYVYTGKNPLNNNRQNSYVNQSVHSNCKINYFQNNDASLNIENGINNYYPDVEPQNKNNYIDYNKAYNSFENTNNVLLPECESEKNPYYSTSFVYSKPEHPFMENNNFYTKENMSQVTMESSDYFYSDTFNTNSDQFNIFNNGNLSYESRKLSSDRIENSLYNDCEQKKELNQNSINHSNSLNNTMEYIYKDPNEAFFSEKFLPEIASSNANENKEELDNLDNNNKDIINKYKQNSIQLENTHKNNLVYIPPQDDDISCNLISKLTSDFDNIYAISSTHMLTNSLNANKSTASTFKNNNSYLDGLNHSNKKPIDKSDIENIDYISYNKHELYTKQDSKCYNNEKYIDRTCDFISGKILEDNVYPCENSQLNRFMPNSNSQQDTIALYLCQDETTIDYEIDLFKEAFSEKNLLKNSSQSNIRVDNQNKTLCKTGILSKQSLHGILIKKNKDQIKSKNKKEKNKKTHMNAKQNKKINNVSCYKNSYQIASFLNKRKPINDLNIFRNTIKSRLKQPLSKLIKKNNAQYKLRRRNKFFCIFRDYLKCINKKQCNKCFLHISNMLPYIIEIHCKVCNFELLRKTIYDSKNRFNCFTLNSDSNLILNFRKVFQVVIQIDFYESVINCNIHNLFLKTYTKKQEIVKKKIYEFRDSECIDFIKKILLDYNIIVQKQCINKKIRADIQREVNISVPLIYCNGIILTILRHTSIILSAIKDQYIYIKIGKTQFYIKNFHLLIYETMRDLFDLLSIEKEKILFFNFYTRFLDTVYILDKLQLLDTTNNENFFATLYKFLKINNANECFEYRKQTFYNFVNLNSVENDFKLYLDEEFNYIEDKMELCNRIISFTRWKCRDSLTDILINISEYVIAFLSILNEGEDKFREQYQKHSEILADLSYQLHICHRQICLKYAEIFLLNKSKNMKYTRIKKNIYNCLENEKYINSETKFIIEKNIKYVLLFLHFFINFSYTLIENEIAELQKISQHGGFKRFY